MSGKEQTWDMHRYMKVPKEYIFAKISFYLSLLVFTLVPFIILMIIRAQTKVEEFVVPQDQERFFLSSPDLSCHVDFTGNCDVYGATFPEKYEETETIVQIINITAGGKSFVDSVTPHSKVTLDFSQSYNPQTYIAGSGSPFGSACEYFIDTVFNNVPINETILPSGFSQSMELKLNDWGEFSIEIKPNQPGMQETANVSVILVKGKLEEDTVSHLDCEKCTMYGWYYISAPSNVFGDCKVESTQSIFPFPVMLLFITCLCIPITLDLFFMMFPPDPCMKLFKKRYEERIRREGEEEIVQ